MCPLCLLVLFRHKLRYCDTTPMYSRRMHMPLCPPAAVKGQGTTCCLLTACVTICVACSVPVWLLVGLGTRGLLYHAWLGKLMAAAVLSNSEAGFPHELLEWRGEAASTQAQDSQEE
jgi:glycine/D-amino acid oxidase-like deaminating enzyme